jgi:hypothetical protein
MRDIVSALMDGRDETIAKLVTDIVAKVQGGALTVDDFARRESITSKTFSTPSNRRLAQALSARGVAIGDKVRVYQRSDGELALAEEYAGDEDREYLIRRISDFVARFGELVPPEVQRAASRDRDQLSLLEEGRIG